MAHWNGSECVVKLSRAEIVDKSQTRDLEVLCSLPPHPVSLSLISIADILKNVVQFLGFYTSPQLSIVMEFMSLGSLHSYIMDKEKILNGRMAVKIALDTVAGMVT